MAEQNFTKERDDEVLPVVRELLKIVGVYADKLKLGAIDAPGCATSEEKVKIEAEIYEQHLIPLLKEHNLKVDDLTWLFQVLRQPIDGLQSTASMAFDEYKEVADTRVYGVAPSEMRIMDLDKAMRKGEKDPVDKKVETK